MKIARLDHSFFEIGEFSHIGLDNIVASGDGNLTPRIAEACCMTFHGATGISICILPNDQGFLRAQKFHALDDACCVPNNSLQNTEGLATMNQ